jgi:hypothetical protein
VRVRSEPLSEELDEEGLSFEEERLCGGEGVRAKLGRFGPVAQARLNSRDVTDQFVRSGYEPFGELQQGGDGRPPRLRACRWSWPRATTACQLPESLIDNESGLHKTRDRRE